MPRKRKTQPDQGARDTDGRFAGNHAASVGTRFGPGNQAAKGHGRPPDRVKRALAEVLDEVRDGVALSQLALDTIKQAMLDRDDSGNVTAAGVNAARLVLAYRHGLPKQTTEINVSGQAVIATVRGVMAKMVVEDARAAQHESTALPGSRS